MFVFSVEVALSLATFIKVEGNTSGAFGWRPISTTSRVVPKETSRVLRVPTPPHAHALLQLEATSTGAVVSTAPLPVVRAKR